ncbi:uncharacterized protein LOC107621113 [Arachis ipaensis]|uniref:uncharacterized protein LOC107621113 n=1 Tax=Arachis ipaensis TaxID=130454 RepID=UPI0007AF07F3|nr:uncharacterized protein LOC107621113 [Arachis ipaensis]XP_025685534.1 uncharacterized protein LOC112786361 [Arachis hypogaea]
MGISNHHPKVHLHAIKSGLRPEKFQEAIIVAKPKILAKFRKKTKGQMEIEELYQAQKSEKNQNNKDDDKTRDNKKPFWLTPRYESYTQFNTKREEIIKEILNLKLIKPPRKAGTYQDMNNVDKTKYCAFHQKHRHITDECVVAKDLLERLSQQRHLDKYIDSHIQKRNTYQSDLSSAGQSSRDKDIAYTAQPNQPRGVINCISGGFTGGGASSSACKFTYRAMLAVESTNNNHQTLPIFPEMTFQQSDFNSTELNLDDPVVISIQLGDLIVQKVLLDPGSSADVLFYSTFKKMKLSDNILVRKIKLRTT